MAEYVTPQAVARALGVSTFTLARWARDGGIDPKYFYVTSGRQRRFRSDFVKDYKKSCQDNLARSPHCNSTKTETTTPTGTTLPQTGPSVKRSKPAIQPKPQSGSANSLSAGRLTLEDMLA